MTPALQEALFQCARDEFAQAEAMRRSWSGADQVDSWLHDCANRVYAAVGDGAQDLETVIAQEDARWRAYVAAQVRRVDEAPKFKRGPRRGQSTIEHRWVNSEQFTNYAHHIRTMIRILTERHGLAQCFRRDVSI